VKAEEPADLQGQTPAGSVPSEAFEEPPA